MMITYKTEEKTEKQTREEIIKESNKNTMRKITDGKYEEREINGRKNDLMKR